MTARDRGLILIATFNEKDNLKRLVQAIHAAIDADLLIIDDSSPDGTGDIADRLAEGDPRIHVIHRPVKQGVASARHVAFREALDSGYDWLVEMDADFSHPPEDLPRLVEGLGRADIVLGSRGVPGGRVTGRSRWRNALTTFGTLYARLMLGLSVRDCTGGYRCSSRRALAVIDPQRLASRGYGFQIELNWAWKKAGMRILEIPIVFPDRTAGATKMSSDILVEALLVVLRLRLGRLRPALHSQSV